MFEVDLVPALDRNIRVRVHAVPGVAALLVAGAAGILPWAVVDGIVQRGGVYLGHLLRLIRRVDRHPDKTKALPQLRFNIGWDVMRIAQGKFHPLFYFSKVILEYNHLAEFNGPNFIFTLVYFEVLMLCRVSVKDLVEKICEPIFKRPLPCPE